MIQMVSFKNMIVEPATMNFNGDGRSRMLVSIKIVKGIKYFEKFSFTERNIKSLPKCL